jgi:hypothetical protein
LHHTRSSTRTPNASDARRGARVGRLFFGRAAYRASPETRRARHRVASSTREARHPAARPADREDAGKLPTAAVAKPPDKISLEDRKPSTCFFFSLFVLATSRHG